GIGLFYDRTALSTRYFDPENLNDDDEPVDNPRLGFNSPANFPARVVTTYAGDGQTILDGPREFLHIIRNPLRDARSLRWSLQIDSRLAKHLSMRTGYVHSFKLKDTLITTECSHNSWRFEV